MSEESRPDGGEACSQAAPSLRGYSSNQQGPLNMSGDSGRLAKVIEKFERVRVEKDILLRRNLTDHLEDTNITFFDVFVGLF
jgi:hypothetical protein